MFDSILAFTDLAGSLVVGGYAVYFFVGGTIAWRAFDVPPEPSGLPLMDDVRRRASGAFLAAMVREGVYRFPTPPQPARAYRPPKTRRDDAFLLFVHAHPLGRLRKHLDRESAYGESLFEVRRTR